MAIIPINDNSDLKFPIEEFLVLRGDFSFKTASKGETKKVPVDSSKNIEVKTTIEDAFKMALGIKK